MKNYDSVSQEIIELYDDYTHKPLDRRSFMQRLVTMAGSSAAALALLPILENDYAKAAIVSENDEEIEITKESFNSSVGEVTLYSVRPKDKTNLPTVLVIHENRGLNPHIKDITRRLAKAGFLAIAPDALSIAGGTPKDEDEARTMIKALDKEKTKSLYLECSTFAKNHKYSNKNLGVVGFCWGGGMANMLASFSDDVNAVVSYYGMQLNEQDSKNVKVPLLLHYAGLDTRINSGISAYVSNLLANNVEFNLHMYKNVNHAFNNDTNKARYNKESALISWKRTKDFLNLYLN